jgi:hypothetical protein
VPRSARGERVEEVELSGRGIAGRASPRSRGCRIQPLVRRLAKLDDSEGADGVQLAADHRLEGMARDAKDAAEVEHGQPALTVRRPPLARQVVGLGSTYAEDLCRLLNGEKVRQPFAGNCAQTTRFQRLRMVRLTQRKHQ